MASFRLLFEKKQQPEMDLCHNKPAERTYQ